MSGFPSLLLLAARTVHGPLDGAIQTGPFLHRSGHPLGFYPIECHHPLIMMRLEGRHSLPRLIRHGYIPIDAPIYEPPAIIPIISSFGHLA